MIPMVVNDGPIWLVGIAWHADKLAAVFAWWMPFNLLTYLALVGWGRFCNGWEIRDSAVSLKRLLLSMLLTWPVLLFALLLLTYDVVIAQPRRAKKKARWIAQRKAEGKNWHWTQDF